MVAMWPLGLRGHLSWVGTVGVYMAVAAVGVGVAAVGVSGVV